MDSWPLAHASADEMVEFVSLWSLVQDVQLCDHQEEIMWRWTESGNYTAKSAY
jgi:hypothetical protein